jgi:hypothetical protein
MGKGTMTFVWRLAALTLPMVGRFPSVPLSSPRSSSKEIDTMLRRALTMLAVSLGALSVAASLDPANPAWPTISIQHRFGFGGNGHYTWGAYLQPLF